LRIEPQQRTQWRTAANANEHLETNTWKRIPGNEHLETRRGIRNCFYSPQSEHIPSTAALAVLVLTKESAEQHRKKGHWVSLKEDSLGG
jgi:hypothetical protein